VVAGGTKTARIQRAAAAMLKILRSEKFRNEFKNIGGYHRLNPEFIDNSASGVRDRVRDFANKREAFLLFFPEFAT
jgi:hypothetical protein